MLSVGEVRRSLAGAGALLLGRKSGLGNLDLTVDGFWRSFWAIPLSLPPLILGNDSYVRETIASNGGDYTSLMAQFLFWEHAAIPVLLVMLALAMRGLGVSRHFVTYVIAGNWAGLLLSWCMDMPLVLFFYLTEDFYLLAITVYWAAYALGLLGAWLLLTCIVETRWIAAVLYVGQVVIYALFYNYFLSAFSAVPAT